jgi:glycosyltransferase involved in cell wall biosynthesis
MKQICIDARMIMNSGIGTYLKNLIPRIKEGPFSLKIIAHPSCLESWAPLSSYDLILCSAPIYSIQEQLKLPLLIPSCDLFWSPHFNIPLLPIKATKRLVTIHDVYYLAFIRTLSLLRRSYAKVVYGKAVSLSDKIITDSHFSSSELQTLAKAKKEKIEVIHLGVDQSRFSVGQEESVLEQVRTTYALGEKFILFVSNLTQHKNLTGLLRAFRYLLDHGFQEYRLVVVGKKLKEDGSSQILEKDPFLAKHVSFLGIVEEGHLPLLYKLATVSIMPSFYEGFGLPPLEAMSSGCPVVVSKAASLPEVCGDSAEYVDPQDYKDIARGLAKVLTDPTLRKELKDKGLQRSQQFTWEKTAEKHIQILEEMCMI